MTKTTKILNLIVLGLLIVICLLGTFYKHISFGMGLGDLMGYIVLYAGTITHLILTIKSREKGLKCSKNAFWQVIRNPIYCGKIFIPAFKDEESCFVEGQHDAIITENIFEQVQEILDGRGRKYSKNRK